MATHAVDIHEAESRLSELIREVEQGGDVIVARNGQPPESSRGRRHVRNARRVHGPER